MLVTLMAVIGFSLPVVVGAVAPVASRAGASIASISTPFGQLAASAGSRGSVPVQGGAGSPQVTTASTPHPGHLYVNEIAAGGSPTGLDPAVAYNTVDAEPLLNIYETLVEYNNSSSNTYTPALATCVPGTVQCSDMYGNTLVYDAAGNPTTPTATGTLAPVYWSFEIDPNARFYNPGIVYNALGTPTPYAVPVYPTDVMFSIARDIAWSDLPYATGFPGWIMAQALLPAGNNGWDTNTVPPTIPDLSFFGHGDHYPYNNTPGNIMASMLVNDSTFCPTLLVTGPASNGCITFVANGAGTVGTSQNWPNFLEYIADGMGASILPCGAFSYFGAGIPGWGSAQANASFGDGSCMLPTGFDNTNGTGASAWATYLAGLTAAPTSWDAFEGLANNELTGVAPQYFPIWYGIGSGPYYIGTPTSPGSDPRFTGYALTENPDYASPFGCYGGVGPAFNAPGCFPQANTLSHQYYVPNVQVTYEAGTPQTDAATQAAYQSSAIDFGGYTPADTSMLLAGAKAGYLQYFVAPVGSSYSDFFIPLNLNWSSSAYVSDDFGSPPNIPSDFFSYLAARDFMAYSFPYGTAFSTLYKADGVVLQYPAGGPAAYGMAGNLTNPAGYYPMNVTYPGCMSPIPAPAGTSCNPPTPKANDSSSPQSWAYYWAAGTQKGNPLYDPELAKCTTSTPCTLELFGESGATDLNTALQDWASDIKADTGGAIIANFEVLTFAELIVGQIYAAPGSGPADVWNLGWAPDYANPYDYYLPMMFPTGTYPAPDDVSPQLSLPAFQAGTCPAQNPTTVKDLYYWVNNPIPNDCQGFAYQTANYFANISQGMPQSTAEVIDNAVGHIYNDLSLYIWQGQANEIPAFAPWINPATVNTNPMQGGGNDQQWFKIGYLNLAVTGVTFVEHGLPTGAEWAVSRGAGYGGAGTVLNATVSPSYPTNSTVGVGGTTFWYSMPLGKGDAFTPVVVEQASHTAFYNFSYASIPSPYLFTKNITVNVYFTALGNISIQETGLTNTTFVAPSLCATFTGTAVDSPSFSSCDQYTNVSPYVTTTGQDVPAGTYTVTLTGGSVPGYALCTKGGPKQNNCVPGSLTTTYGLTAFGKPSKPITVAAGPAASGLTVSFYPVYVTATFTESGLPTGDVWGVSVQNYTALTSGTAFAQTINTAGKSVVFTVQLGSGIFSFVVNSNPIANGFLPMFATGFFGSSASAKLTIPMVDPARTHVVLYQPEAVRRAESLPTVR